MTDSGSSIGSAEETEFSNDDCAPKKPPCPAKPACPKKSTTSLKKKKSSSCAGSKKCAKPGKVTRNPFFNFLREFRTKNCGKSMVQIAKEGGACWNKMSEKDKEKYRKMACTAPKTKRHRRSKCVSKKRKRHRKRSRGCKTA